MRLQKKIISLDRPNRQNNSCQLECSGTQGRIGNFSQLSKLDDSSKEDWRNFNKFIDFNIVNTAREDLEIQLGNDEDPIAIDDIVKKYRQMQEK